MNEGRIDNCRNRKRGIREQLKWTEVERGWVQDRQQSRHLNKCNVYRERGARRKN